MEKLKKIMNVLSYVALGVFILFVLLLVGVRIFGMEPYIVLSGSMEPDIKTGSMIYAKKISPEEACSLEVGDTVTYVVDKKGTKVTHRIYEVVGPAYIKNQYGELVLDENGDPQVAMDDKGYPIIMYTTYGINNKNDSDPSGYTLDGTLGVGNLASSNVIGKPLFVIPYLGFITSFVQNPPGRYLALIACAILIFSTFFTGSSEEAAPVSEATVETPEESSNAEKNEDGEEPQPKSE